MRGRMIYLAVCTLFVGYFGLLGFVCVVVIVILAEIGSLNKVHGVEMKT